MTIKVEKRILEISQSTTDLWKTDFRAKNPVGLKIFKPAINGITKRINDTASILFFTRVREKGQKSRRFEKIACEPSLGAGTGRQSQRTKIPVRGLKLLLKTHIRPLSFCQRTKIPVRGLKLHRIAFFYSASARMSAYQNPRKGTETDIFIMHRSSERRSQRTKIPVRGLKRLRLIKYTQLNP